MHSVHGRTYRIFSNRILSFLNITSPIMLGTNMSSVGNAAPVFL
uniref:Uncharacterized protein n=1 Tax=Arundo donax TaxID=35708 RepID=A0A0A9G1P6_ARUDO